jgi:hypothetical protein
MQKEKLNRPTLAVANTTAIDGAVPADTTSERHMRTHITKTITNGRKGRGANGRSINESESPTGEKSGEERIEELVKKQLGNIGEAENAFESASALLEKHKTKYPALEQYIEHVSVSDRSIQILEDNKDPKRGYYIFKILLTGVECAYQVTHPGERDHTNVDRAAWMFAFEVALAKAIAQLTLSRRATGMASAITVKGELLPP